LLEVPIGLHNFKFKTEIPPDGSVPPFHYSLPSTPATSSEVEESYLPRLGLVLPGRLLGKFLSLCMTVRKGTFVFQILLSHSAGPVQSAAATVGRSLVATFRFLPSSSFVSNPQRRCVHPNQTPRRHLHPKASFGAAMSRTLTRFAECEPAYVYVQNVLEVNQHHLTDRQRSVHRNFSRRSQPEKMGTDNSASSPPESTTFVLDSNSTGTYLAARNPITAGTLIMTDPGVDSPPPPLPVSCRELAGAVCLLAHAAGRGRDRGAQWRARE
jgi:hypothetical protein